MAATAIYHEAWAASRIVRQAGLESSKLRLVAILDVYGSL